MKKILLSLFLLGALSGFSQGIYHGYPYRIHELRSDDKIFVDIPIHRDGRFLPDGGIEDLISFLNNDHSHSFEIRIHYFYGSDEWNQSYSEFIARCLMGELSLKCKSDNYTVSGCGESFPIFLDEKDKKYRAMNTFMEIIVK